MRITLTLDDDNAAAVERIKKRRGAGEDEVVNEALRLGLKELERALKRSETPYRVTPVDVGRCRLENLDDVTAALAVAEGEES